MLGSQGLPHLRPFSKELMEQEKGSESGVYRDDLLGMNKDGLKCSLSLSALGKAS